jgi:ATP-dependent protease HslVU (ClpYQ) peptidase subunit
MTCIVAIVNPITKESVMAGDRAISDVGQGFIAMSRHPKIFMFHPFLIGYAGDVKVGKLIQYYFEPSQPQTNIDLDEHMNTIFVSELKHLLSENEYETNKEEHSTFGLVVAIEGRIFEITEGFEALEYTTNYMAIGSASEYALGSLHTTELNNKITIRDKAVYALSAAAAFSPSCSEPFDILSIGEK